MFCVGMIVGWLVFVSVNFAELEFNAISNSLQSLNFKGSVYNKSYFWQKYGDVFRMKRTLYKGAIGQFEVGVRKRPAMYASWRW